ncbi:MULTISPECIES: hypothetical protein [unclassified Saccharothrix]|uniref:hypothetical protein n=1 Tax=unclassified Saccharothrix TaxID=2593673 RepID=UPI00307CD41C
MRYHLDLVLWKRITCTREARDQALPLLDAVFNPRRDNTAERRRLLVYPLSP